MSLISWAAFCRPVSLVYRRLTTGWKWCSHINLPLSLFLAGIDSRLSSGSKWWSHIKYSRENPYALWLRDFNPCSALSIRCWFLYICNEFSCTFISSVYSQPESALLSAIRHFVVSFRRNDMNYIDVYFVNYRWMSILRSIFQPFPQTQILCFNE